MKTTAFLLCALLIASAPAWAQSIDDVRPACGAPGDRVLISGEGFADEPAVTIDGIEADVLGAKDGRILVEIPDGASGAATIDADGATWDDFTVVAADAPVVHHISASTATPGQVVIVIGRRLADASVEFVDGDGVVQATADLAGGRRALGLKVPDDLDPGTYTLLITNGDGVDSGDCSPEIEIVAAGDADLDSIEPEGQLPGQHLVLTGTNLGPFGPVAVIWTDSGDNELKTLGFSNGFDRVFTRVPFQATAGETYDVSAVFRDDSTSNGVSYTVGTPGEPFIEEIDPAKGPAGSVFALRGENLIVFGSKAKVEMTSGDTTIEAKVFLGHPGFGGKASGLLVMVPQDAAEAVYDVTVTVGDQTSNAETFEVADLPLTVTKMSPDSQGTDGTMQRVFIEGTGFGPPRTTTIAVIWEKDGAARKGHLLFRSERLLVLIPPGGRWEPLDAGTYNVTVVLDPEGDATSADAGTYTVK